MFHTCLAVQIVEAEQTQQGPSRWFQPFQTRMMTLGRLPFNDVVLPEPSVSGIHARIYQNEHQLFIEDLNSTNGTFINGFPTLRGQMVVLRDGDSLQLGSLRLHLHLEALAEGQESGVSAPSARPPEQMLAMT